MNYRIFVYFAVAAFFIAGTMYLKLRRDANRLWQNAPFLQRFPLPLPYNYTTPRGARVCSQMPLPADPWGILGAIDDGISDYLRSTAALGYERYRQHGDFVFWMLGDWMLGETGTPALRIKLGDVWRNTEFDKGGYMLAAGLTLGLADGLFTPPTIFIPQTANLEFLRTIARYEPEHIAAFANDPELFARTSGRHVHPIYPLPEEENRSGRQTADLTACVAAD